MSVELQWPGKAEARAQAEVPPIGRLVPLPDTSPQARHRLIAGDNLAVLGHLHEELQQRVRLIYIDPPYNTGHDFLFRDRFGRGADKHEGWLSFMLPRLIAARRLLHPEGVIFVSIDDRELHRLRLLMDEVFGADNAVATVVWQKVFAPKNSARHFSVDHEYVLVYAADAERWRPKLLPRRAEADARYKNPDDDPRGPWASDNLCARNPYRDGVYAIITPAGRVIEGPPPGTYWRVSAKKLEALRADNRIWWGPTGDNQPRLKRFLSEVKEGRVPQTLWGYREVGHTQQAKRELLARVSVQSAHGIFDTPKPLALIERIVRLATEPGRGDWVLDFFAGTGTTAEAVWRVNAADGGDRRVCLVELDEPCDCAPYECLIDITAARLQRAAELLAHEHSSLDTSLARWSWQR